MINPIRRLWRPGPGWIRSEWRIWPRQVWHLVRNSWKTESFVLRILVNFVSTCKGGGYGGGQGGYGQQGGYGGYDQGGYGARTIDNYMPRDTSDCIYVNGLPTGTQKSDISNHFCRAGTILVTKGNPSQKTSGNNLFRRPTHFCFHGQTEDPNWRLYCNLRKLGVSRTSDWNVQQQRLQRKSDLSYAGHTRTEAALCQ